MDPSNSSKRSQKAGRHIADCSGRAYGELARTLGLGDHALWATLAFFECKNIEWETNFNNIRNGYVSPQAPNLDALGPLISVLGDLIKLQPARLSSSAASNT